MSDAALCDHCSLPVPAGLFNPEAKAQFCCAGCDMAWQIIHGGGLEDFYRLRASVGTAQKAQTTFGKYAAWDAPEFLASHARATGDGCLQADLVIEGIHCAACVWLLEKTPRLVPGSVSARASLGGRTLRMVWDPAQTRFSAIAKMLDTLGYPPSPARAGEAKRVRSREDRRQLAALGAAGCIAGNVMMLSVALYFGDHFQMESDTRLLLRWISAGLGMLALLWPGQAFFRSALAALRTRTPNLDLPIALGLGIGGISGVANTVLGRGELWFDTLAMLVFLLLVGRYLRFRQQRRADEAVALMFSLTPSSAHRLTPAATDANEDEEVPIEALKVGDRLRVLAGERVPADGVVESGSARVNQALMTGESDWLPIGSGASLLAGSVIEGAPIVMRATACGADSRAGRLMAEVEQAVCQRAPVMEFSDRLAGRFVVWVMLAAAATFAFWSWHASLWTGLENAVALLVIACPCALGLATPLTFAAAIGRLAKRDILVKGASALERLASGGTLVLDKTGTLTQGRPAPVKVLGDASVLGWVAALEKNSLHPLAKAAVQAWGHLPGASARVSEVVEVAGAGMRGRIDGQWVGVGSPDFVGVSMDDALAGFTPVIITVNDQWCASVGFGDALRPEAAATLARLRSLGWQAQMLSGDAQSVVTRIAAEVGIGLAVGQATPEAKQQAILDLKEKAGPHVAVVMVGDGVNDAAALASADAGIAVHGGAEASLAAADIYIAKPGLSPLVELFSAAKRTQKVLQVAWTVSLAYNLGFIALAAAGVLKPWMAAILMPLSSISVMLIAVGGHRRKESP